MKYFILTEIVKTKMARLDKGQACKEKNMKKTEIEKILKERNQNGEDVAFVLDTNFFGYGSLEKLKEAHLQNYAVNIKEDCLKFIENSWTWEKLTKEEKQRFFLVVKKTKIFGTYEQRKEILQSIYWAFLNGLDYSPLCWREKNFGGF